MFIDRSPQTPSAPFEGAESFLSVHALVDFRSFERSCYGLLMDRQTASLEQMIFTP